MYLILDNIIIQQQDELCYTDPNTIAPLLSAIRAVEYLMNKPGCEIFEKDIARKLITNKYAELLESAKRTPYFASNDPVKDKRLMELLEIYDAKTKNNSSNINIKPIYEALIEQHDMDEFLENKYQTLKLSSKEKKALQNRKLEKMYILSEMLKNKRDSLPGEFLDDFKILDEISKFSCNAIRNFYADTNEVKDFEVKLTIGIYKRVKFNTPFDTLLYYKNINNKTKAYQHQITDPSIAIAFDDNFKSIEQDNRSSNIQVNLSHKIMRFNLSHKIMLLDSQMEEDNNLEQQDIKISRDLQYLVATPAAQLDLNLGYFSDNMALLKEKNMQQYLEYNIFKPGVLLNVLAKDSNIIKKINNFCSKGMLFFQQDKETSENSLYFIEIYLNSLIYADKVGIDVKVEIKELYDKLNQQLSITVSFRQACVTNNL